MYTELQLQEMRDLILPCKSEEMRALFRELDTKALFALYDWATEYRDKYPDFFRECLAILAIKDLWTMCTIVLGYRKELYGSDMNPRLHGAICHRLAHRP